MTSAPGVDVAKIDLETITEFQKELHWPQPEPGTSEVDGEYVSDVTSNFILSFKKTSWHSRVFMELTPTSSEETITYTANNMFHRLEYVDLIQEIPALQVKKEFRDKIRIAWCHNLLHNIMGKASMFNREIYITDLTSHYMDHYAQHYLKPGIRELYNIGIGNVPFLEQWSDFLPGYTLTGLQPWPFSEDLSLSFPLFLLSPTQFLNFKYHPQLNINKLLRMQRQVDGVWKDIKCNLRYLDGTGTTGTLRNPVLRGCYVYLTDDEIQAYICHNKKHVFYYNHVVPATGLNSVGYGVYSEITVRAGPCKALHWSAENLNQVAFNNHSNYTTSDNVYEGWAPWESYKLKYATSTRVESTSSAIAERLDPLHHSRTPPMEAGYGSYFFAHDPMSLAADIGIALHRTSGTLYVKLGNTDPHLRPVKGYSADNGDDDDFGMEEGNETGGYTDIASVTSAPKATDRERKSDFVVRAHMIVTRKLIFTQTPQGHYDLTIEDDK